MLQVTTRQTRKNAIVEYLDYHKGERYSRVPRLSGRKNAVVEYLDYQIEEERYSRVPRLSDTPVTQLNRDLSSKARLKCATYRRQQQSEIKMRHLPAVC